MSQRVTLAQTQLQMAQSDPNTHNIYEAYKRMYQSLGVKDIDAILPPPSTPKPKDPALENSDSLLGKKLIAFRNQEHQAHIDAHRTFMSSMLVRNNPQATVLLQAHVMEHVSLLARQMVEAENQEQIQAEAAKFGGKLPPELQAQFQEEMERQISLKATEFIEEMFIEEQQAMEGQGQDPLVGLKQQELQLKAQDIQRKAENDAARIDIDTQKNEANRRFNERKDTI